MRLQTKRQNAMTPQKQTRQTIALNKALPVPTRKTKRIHSNPALSQTSAKIHSKTRLTSRPPKATIATPLLKPATDTGVFRRVVVPSPICAKNRHSRQPDTRIPRSMQQPPQHKH
jgi:hypothetical protein